MWYKQISTDSDVVISSRVRFARNIYEYKFPHIMEKDDLLKIISIVENSIDKNNYKLLRLKDIDKTTKASLVEQHLVSKEFILNEDAAIVTNEDSTIVAMINEEDHLRIQSFESGFNIDKCYDKLVEFTNQLNKKLKFAHSDKYGYITACPTNLGSGMRASVMLHLPALYKVGILPELFNQVASIGVSIRGLYGENTVGEGYIYQVSNQKTLGISDRDIISNLEVIVMSIVEQERKARQILLKSSINIEDEVYRAYGILKNARLITDEEAIKLLSKLRLGVAMNIINDIDLKKVQSIMQDIEPNTLKLLLKKDLSKSEEESNRAEYIRKEIE